MISPAHTSRAENIQMTIFNGSSLWPESEAGWLLMSSTTRMSCAITEISYIHVNSIGEAILRTQIACVSLGTWS